MIEFFSKIGDLISTVINFVVSAIKNIIMLITMIPKAYAAIVQALALMPAFLTVPILAVIAVSIIIAVMNKWG